LFRLCELDQLTMHTFFFVSAKQREKNMMHNFFACL